MRKTVKHSLIALLILAGLFCLENASARLKIGFYNTRNLFDTINDPGTRDGEFTPTGQNKWTAEKYARKLKGVAGVLQTIDVAGLCEVENAGVMRDLCGELERQSGEAWGFVHYDSRDSRGIDVAIVYRKSTVAVGESELVKTGVWGARRDFLRCRVRDARAGGNAVFYVTHFPSKIGGARAQASRDSLVVRLEHLTALEARGGQSVVVMGDMNDDPLKIGMLRNIASEAYEKGVGSYWYRGIWYMFDQVLLGGRVAANCSEMGVAGPRGEGSEVRAKKPWDEAAVSDHLMVYFWADF